MYSDRRGTDKNNPGQNLPDKRPLDKTLGQKAPRTIERICTGVFCPEFFVLDLLKMGGPRCVTYFRGGPGCVTKCDRKEGSKLTKNSMTYFMDGPFVPEP